MVSRQKYKTLKTKPCCCHKLYSKNMRSVRISALHFRHEYAWMRPVCAWSSSMALEWGNHPVVWKGWRLWPCVWLPVCVETARALRMRQSFVVLQGICCQLQPSSVLIQFWRPIGSLFVLIARALLAVCCWLLSLISIPWERPFAFSPYDITSWAFRLPLMLAALLPILPGLDIQSGTVAWNRA